MNAILNTNSLHVPSVAPDMRSMHVTPTIAREWLKRNLGNRPVKPTHVARLADAIRRGLWKMTGDAIRFSTTGKLIDGQHRLHAIIEAEVGVNCVVMFGLGDDIFDVIDSGSGRSKADVVFVKYQLPVAKSALLSSAANLALQYESGITSLKGSVASDDLLKFIDNNPDVVDAVSYVYDNAPRESPIPKSIAAAFFLFAARKDRLLAESFILRFMVGAVNGPEDNLLHLRNFCLKARAVRRPVQAGDIFGRLIVVWNSERRGKPIKHATNIRVRANESTPKFI